MKYAIIENQMVTNVIEASPEFVAEHYPSAVELDKNAGIGWGYVKDKFVAPKPVIVDDETTVQ